MPMLPIAPRRTALHRTGLAAAACLTAGLVASSHADVITVDPVDGSASNLMLTPPGASSIVVPAIPAGFFGPGSDAHPGGLVKLMGLPLVGTPPLGPTGGYGIPGQTDTIVLRKGPGEIDCGEPSITIPILIHALSLVSTHPITVTFNGGADPTPYELLVSLSKTASQGEGIMIVSHTTHNGGYYLFQYAVTMRLQFNKAVMGGPGNPTSTIDPYTELLTNGGQIPAPWQHTPNGVAVQDSPLGGLDDHDVNSFTADEMYPPTTNFIVGIASGGTCAGFTPGKAQLIQQQSASFQHGVLPPLEPPGIHTGFGDGVAGPCPCGNESPVGSGRGCLNSSSNAAVGGALLFAVGIPDVSSDSVAHTTAVTLRAIDMPNTSAACLFFQGDSFSVLPFSSGDGLRYAAGNLLRIGTKNLVNGKASYGALLQETPVSIKGQIPAVGGTRWYQGVYRDGAAFCTPASFNWTNVVAIEWMP